MLKVASVSVSKGLAYYSKDDELGKVIPGGRGREFHHFSSEGFRVSRLKDYERERLYAGLAPNDDFASLRADHTGGARSTSATDVMLAAPKSVSIMATLGGDTRLIEAFERVNRKMMVRMRERFGYHSEWIQEGEQRRKWYQAEDMLSESHLHFTSRDGDPHLHGHNVVFNTTQDRFGNWVKGEIKGLKYVARLEGLKAMADLAAEVQALGYDIDVRPDGTWDLKCVSREMIEAMSRRSVVVNENKAFHLFMKDLWRELKESGFYSAKMKGVKIGVRPETLGELSDLGYLLDDKGNVIGKRGRNWEDYREIYLKRSGGKSEWDFRRGRPEKDMSPVEVMAQWSEDEKRLGVVFRELRQEGVVKQGKLMDTNYAIQRITEKRSKVSENQLMAQHLMRNMGRGTSDEICDSAKLSPQIVELEDGRSTSVELLAKEQEILGMYNDGMGEVDPLVADRAEMDRVIEESGFRPDQADFYRQMVSHTGRVSVGIGVAGSGKSYVLKRISDNGLKAGYKIRCMATDGVIAQSLGSEMKESLSDSLRESVSASTVHGFLSRSRLREDGSGADEIILVDEAGKLSTELGHRLLSEARRLGSRVMLVGDPSRQYTAVEAGNPALLLSDRFGGPEMTVSVRQKGAVEQDLGGRSIEELRDDLRSLFAGAMTHEDLEARGYGEALMKESLRESMAIYSDLIHTQGLAERGIDEGIEEGDLEMLRVACIADFKLRSKEIKNRSSRMNYATARFFEYIDEGKECGFLVDRNEERREVTAKVRRALVARGVLGGDAYRARTRRTEDLSEMDTRSAKSFSEGDEIRFVDYVPGLEGLDLNADYKVCRVSKKRNSLFLEIDGKRVEVACPKLGRLTRVRDESMEVRLGDRLMFKKNHVSLSGKERSNGEALTVEKIESGHLYYRDKDGELDRMSMAKAESLDYGWVMTAYSSQGKTFDYCVYLMDSALASSESYYVANTRARFNVEIVVDNLEKSIGKIMKRTGQEYVYSKHMQEQGVNYVKIHNKGLSKEKNRHLADGVYQSIEDANRVIGFDTKDMKKQIKEGFLTSIGVEKSMSEEERQAVINKYFDEKARRDFIFTGNRVFGQKGKQFYEKAVAVFKVRRESYKYRRMDRDLGLSDVKRGISLDASEAIDLNVSLDVFDID